MDRMDRINVIRNSATSSAQSHNFPIPADLTNLYKELRNVAIPFDEGFHCAFSNNLEGTLKKPSVVVVVVVVVVVAVVA